MPKLSEKMEKISTKARILSLLCAIIATPACATTNQDVKPEAQKPENPEPEWINGPNSFEKDGVLYGVGCAKITKNLAAAMSRSEGVARTNLARLKVGENIFSTTLTGSEVIERKIVEERDELCTLMRMEK